MGDPALTRFRRSLPTAQEAARILAERRTRPTYRPAAPAGRLFAGYLKTLEARFGPASGAPGASGLRARWSEIVGETLARRTEPVKLIRARNGGPAVLELKVEGPAAALVQHQAPQILARVDMVLGKGSVARLRIVQGPVRPPPVSSAGAAQPSPRLRRAAAAAPLDAAAEAELAAGLAALPEGQLRSALLRLGRAVIRHS